MAGGIESDEEADVHPGVIPQESSFPARIFRGEPAPDTDAGWQVFHDMQNDAEDTPNVRLAGTQEAVQRVLDRTGLSRLFTIDATAETAVATLQGA